MQVWSSLILSSYFVYSFFSNWLDEEEGTHIYGSVKIFNEFASNRDPISAYAK